MNSSNDTIPALTSLKNADYLYKTNLFHKANQNDVNVYRLELLSKNRLKWYVFEQRPINDANRWMKDNERNSAKFKGDTNAKPKATTRILAFSDELGARKCQTATGHFVSLGANIQLIKKIPTFLKLYGSSPYAQNPITGHCPEPFKSSLYSSIVTSISIFSHNP